MRIAEGELLNQSKSGRAFRREESIKGPTHLLWSLSSRKGPVPARLWRLCPPLSFNLILQSHSQKMVSTKFFLCVVSDLKVTLLSWLSPVYKSHVRFFSIHFHDENLNFFYLHEIITKRPRSFVWHNNILLSGHFHLKTVVESKTCLLNKKWTV